MKTIKRIIIVAVILFVTGFVFSLLFPGNVKLLDDIRLFFQRPLVRWAGNIRTAPGFSRGDYISLEELSPFLEELTPGSIFFTKTSDYPISSLIPGEWKHTGIFLGTREQLAAHLDTSGVLFKTLDTLMPSGRVYVLDSYSEGVSVHPIGALSNLNAESSLTYFAAFSFTGSAEQRERFISGALAYSGLEYDYDWITEDPSAIFCSELLYHSLKAIDIHVRIRTRTISRDIFTPDDLFRFLRLQSRRRSIFSLHGILRKKS
ncbi:MAG: YiiX/YebB-like N1pC/P60 family cysteine hydrolase [Bacteroidales bacterium]